MNGYVTSVWREGDRIRAADGTGYSDRVSDEAIWEHIGESAKTHNVEHLGFAIAVLRLREQERATAPSAEAHAHG